MNASSNYTQAKTWLEETCFLPSSPQQRLRLHQTLLNCYRSNNHAYHNLIHINHLLHLASENRCHFQNWPVVYLAIWFHDVIYDPSRKDNEQVSARLAQDHLTKLGLEPDQVNRVVCFIQATANHQLNYIDESDHEDAKLFLDLDLAILAEPWPRYQRYAEAVRNEYRHISAVTYALGRRNFLRTMLKRPFIFHSPLMRVQWEHKARINIQREILGPLRWLVPNHTFLSKEHRLSSGKTCLIRSVRNTLLSNYFVLAYPKDQGEPNAHEITELMRVGIEEARALAQGHVGNEEAFTVFYSGHSSRREKGWHMHIFLLGSRWRKAWLYLVLSSKNLLQWLRFHKDDLQLTQTP